MPVPIDYKELELIGKTLNMPQEEIFSIWESRLKQILQSGGMNIYSNSELVNTMIDCAKDFILKTDKKI